MNLDNLTDAQIRAKFIELGQPVGPVTATTRKIMLKKLKALIDSGAKPPTTSGEESDGGRLTPRARRKTMQPPKSVSKPSKKKSPVRMSLTPIASSTIIQPPRLTRRGNSREYNNSPYLNDSDDNFLPSPPKYSPLNAQKFGNEAFRASLNASTNHFTPSSSSSSNSLGNSLSFDRVDNRNLSPPDLSYQDAPFASEFLKRLSSSRIKDIPSPSLPSGLSKKLLDVKESEEDTGPPPTYSKFSQGRTAREVINTKGDRRLSSAESWYFLDSPISALLLVLFVLFFGSLGVVYVNKTSMGRTFTSSRDIDIITCHDESAQIPEINCVKEDDKTNVDLIMNIVLSELNEMLPDAPCSSSSIFLSDSDILNLVTRKDKSLSRWVVEYNLNNLKIVFDANPKWNIKPTKDGIELTHVTQTTFCAAMSYVTLVADWIIKICIVFLLLLGIYVSVRWWNKRKAHYKEEVYKLVGNIIEIVSSKSLSSDSFVPISHVRDQLIPLKDRQKMMRLWEDALELLESDSRLRKEVQEVEGEQFLVWRWLASNLTPNKKKVWQGQAFDTLEGNLNSHVESPTNCLKIRHMFEPGQEEGDEWVTTVVDAILEKCGAAKVLHIVVDQQSPEGLVYMKCASSADAGLAYRSLHGSWFASNLITVKYIREHRYHERFPDSVNSTKPLQPSNDNQRSLK